MEPARFSDWEEPIDEEELEAVFRSASAASSTRKRLRVIYADEGGIRNPAVAQGEGADDSGSRLICRRNGRRLPNWGAASDPWPSPSRMGIACESGSPDGGAGTEGRTGAGSASDPWRVLSPPSCRRVDLEVKYPLMSFGGRIVYGRTVSEVEKATRQLLEIIKSKKENLEKISMGFDLEWRPTFRRGEIPRKVAVMQICVDTSHCFVLHIIHSGIPSILKSVLEDSSYVKVGVAIAGDALKMLKDYCVQVAPLDDLSSFANLKLGGTHKTWSLSSLTEMLTCKQLAKPKKIRLGNWEVDMLSRDQLHYAATDAFASWYLYEVLRSVTDEGSKELSWCTYPGRKWGQHLKVAVLMTRWKKSPMQLHSICAMGVAASAPLVHKPILRFIFFKDHLQIARACLAFKDHSQAARMLSRFEIQFMAVKRMEQGIPHQNPIVILLEETHRLQQWRPFAWGVMDILRSLVVISANEGRAAGSGDQHCSISFLHSGSH
ncbi:hypothetical protein Taro_003626 [Colocasia esculenta]|uniref:3'-5' exonuclease n=1 Tax=Colocasia esculenta TaxID=4460 RepID=A0A843TP82_COLES|nr:hypothetical protein [Colocasia esculenta]